MTVSRANISPVSKTVITNGISARMEQMWALVLPECQFQLILMPRPSYYVKFKDQFLDVMMGVRCQRSFPHSRTALPEIQIKYLNLSFFCLPCSHQESWLPAAAAMWEELSTSRGCPRPAKAEQPPSLSLCLSLSLSPPPAPSPPPIWGREDDYHQPAVLQCPDDHLPPAVHCRSVKFSVCLSVSLPVWSAQDIFFNNRSQQTIIQEFQAC